MGPLTMFFVFVAIMWFIKYHWSRRQLYLLSSQLDGPTAWPLIGNALEFFCKNEDIFDAATKLCETYSSPIRLWFGPKFALMFTNVDQVEKIMSSMKFAHKDEVYRFMVPTNGLGLISASGQKWKSDRRLLTPLFHYKNMMSYVNLINEQSDLFAKESLKCKLNQPTFNVMDFLHRYGADVVTEVLMGIQPKAQSGALDYYLEWITEMYVLVHSRIIKVWLQFDPIFNRSKFGEMERKGITVIHGFLKKGLETVKSNHLVTKTNAGGITNSDHGAANRVRSILDHMLDIRDEIPTFATDEEMVYHLSTFYTAAEDTISTITSFALLLFGLHPEIQEKVALEIQSVLGKEVRYVEFKELDGLKYFDLCIKDILRLFPIAPFIMRQTQEEVQLDKWSIPAKCSVIVAIHTIHRDPKLWEKPNDFYPEHFLPDAVSKRHPYAYMPFSAGPRGCVGKVFAHMAMKTVLVKILQMYRIEADGTLQDVKLITDISVRAKDGYNIRLKERI